jgi:hypothetical protein
LVEPAASSIRAARSIDQPLTRPDGSSAVPFGAGTANASNAPIGTVGEVDAREEHVLGVSAQLVDPDLAAGEAADLTVAAVGAESGIDRVQPLDDLGDRCRRRHGDRLAHVDRDDHAHHVLDVCRAGAADGGRHAVTAAPAAAA